MTEKKKTPWYLWPFVALWRLLGFILELTGRLLGVVIGLVLVIVGIVVTLTVIGAVVGVPLIALGLISLQAVAYYPLDPSMLATADYAVAPDLIFDERPNYIVILETYGRNGLLRDPRFEEAYVLCEKIDTDIYGSDGMLVFQASD